MRRVGLIASTGAALLLLAAEAVAADCGSTLVPGETCAEAKTFTTAVPRKDRTKAEGAAKQARDTAKAGENTRKGCPSLSWSMARAPEHCRRGKKDAARKDGALFTLPGGGR